MKKKIPPWLKWGCLTPIVAIVALVLVAYVADFFIPSAARKALPPSATEVQEFYTGRIDFVRCLKARLPDTDFPVYARSLGLTQQFDPAGDTDAARYLNMGFDEAPIWWTPPMADRTTYFQYKRGRDRVEVLKYGGGYVYYMVQAW